MDFSRLTPEQMLAMEHFATSDDPDAFRVFAHIMHPLVNPEPEFDEQPLHLRIFGFLHRAYTVPGFCGVVNIMPRAGKTNLVCMWIAWCYGKQPKCKFMYSTYGGELSEKSGVAIKKIMNTETFQRMFPGCEINPKINARDRFETTVGGEMNCRGVDGVTTGIGAGMRLVGDAPYEFMGALVTDDLLKISDARSAPAKFAMSKFWTESWQTRRNGTSTTPMIVIGQRAAIDDIFGLLNPAKDSGIEKITGDDFEVLEIKVLDRQDRSIWESMFPTKNMHAMRKATPWMFATQYMQEPYAEKGTMFDVDAMPVYDVRPSGPRTACRGWDLAARKLKAGQTEPDFTARALLVYYPDHKIYLIEDFLLYRETPHFVRSDMLHTAGRDGRDVTIRLYQDPGQAGVSQVQDLTSMLTGYKVVSKVSTVDKVVHAEPFAAQCNVGLVGVLRPYAEKVKTHLKPFPNGRHDDGVDALAAAYEQLAIPDEDELSRRRAVEHMSGASRFHFAVPGDPTSWCLRDDPESRPKGYLPGEEAI